MRVCRSDEDCGVREVPVRHSEVSENSGKSHAWTNYTIFVGPAALTAHATTHRESNATKHRESKILPTLGLHAHPMMPPSGKQANL